MLEKFDIKYEKMVSGEDSVNKILEEIIGKLND